MDKKESKIITSVENLKDEIVDFACDLVRQPSTLGNETSVLKVMEDKLKNLGLDPVRIAMDHKKYGDHPGWATTAWEFPDRERYNIVAVRPADAQIGKSALFNGHLDVVSPEPLARWNTDPFEPVVKDGWIHGRGAGDMKAGDAAMCYALKAIEAAGFGLGAPVTIEAVIEEECTGNGALACLLAGYDAEAILIPEPWGPTIETTQVGVLWFKVVLSGVPKHALETHDGVNAIDKCYHIIAALRKLEEELNHPLHPAFESVNIRHPCNLNVGIIKGGDWPSTVPAMAEFHCRLGYMPDVAFEQVRQQIVEVVTKAAAGDKWLSKNMPRVEFYGFRSDGHSLPRNLPVFNVLGDCHKDLTGKAARTNISTSTTDLRVFVHFGKGTPTCFGPEMENIHASNERVNIDSMIHTAKVYALFLSRWCNLVE